MPTQFARRRTWMVFSAATVGVVALALAPPLLSSFGQAVVMQVFSPVCHQIPVRSPHLGGVQLAVCDRCLGIYLGFLAGGVSVPLTWPWREAVLQKGPVLILAAGMVVGVDWVGPFVDLWSNAPLTRSLSGGLFGVTAGMLAGHGLLRSESSSEKRDVGEAQA